MPKPITGPDAKATRTKRGFNQSDWWNPLGLTQSASSRYESGRRIPTPVQMLYTIAYGTPKEANDLVAKLRANSKPAAKVAI